jgi:hypothetical protein
MWLKGWVVGLKTLFFMDDGQKCLCKKYVYSRRIKQPQYLSKDCKCEAKIRWKFQIMLIICEDAKMKTTMLLDF